MTDPLFFLRRLKINHASHGAYTFILEFSTVVNIYAHSKCIGSCSMRIQNMAGAAPFYHIGALSNTSTLHDEIEQLLSHFKCALSRLGYA
jgi:hypothetical protein